MLLRPSLPGSGLPLSRAAWASQLAMVWAVQPNSRASSPGLLPARASSMICSRNAAGYGGLVLAISDSFFHNGKVSVEKGQLQLEI